MQKVSIAVAGLLALTPLWAQTDAPHKTPVMTLGVFHFAYPNRDVVQTQPEDQINVLDAAYQAEIQAIAEALARFRPTVIAVEIDPGQQATVDSLYGLYRDGRLPLDRNEVHQLGFRLAKMLGLDGVRCVNDWGRPYAGIRAMFQDSSRMARFEDYFVHSPDSVYRRSQDHGRVHRIIDALKELNDPDRIHESLGTYLLNPFKYEETPGDFTGVDFETGRWFSRNLRIFRNLQRLPHGPNDRILVIFGAGHLNLLNLFLDVSPEFERVSPLPWLAEAGENQRPCPRP